MLGIKVKTRTVFPFDHVAFLKFIMANDEDSCWQWLGFKDKREYGRFNLRHNKKNYQYMAHRVSYTLFNGEIEEGLVIDHICKNHSCVNPKHLRSVSQRVNATENSTSPVARNHQLEECVRGHVFKQRSLPSSGTHRHCYECAGARSRRYYEKNKEKIKKKRECEECK